MKFQPLGDRIAIEVLPGAGMIGLIHIPDATKSSRNQTFQRALVIGAGAEVYLARVDAEVLVSEYFGDECEVDGHKFKVGRERDIVAVFSLKGRLNPPSDRILLEEIEQDRMAGGILLPEDMRWPTRLAKVVAIGVGIKYKDTLLPFDVLLGDIVHVPRKCGVEVDFGGRKYLLVQYADILGVVT